ncbi:MAG TPA: cobalt-precorrin-5B (C(1))-methyltransferase CbiD, partial [Geobacteraceae bacterium]|nr:cobalt-precorrin-5B (C(1))-methyltransferase CbiD [Geobacteraceae bacterium]
MSRKILRDGYTTGACAAAAAKGAAQMLRDQRLVEEVEINLPSGDTVRFPLRGQVIRDDSASCYVVKDAGDDPDITNGAEIHAKVAIEFFTQHRIVIEGGTGIGKVTKPGLAVPVGEWAINPVPRRMVLEGIKEVFAMRCVPVTLTVSLSIPDGAERAQKTLNSRLGILGGLSILGTTGIVKPVSARAWTDTIDTAIDVALACGCRTVVLSTGRASEMSAQGYRGKGGRGAPMGERLKEEAFVMMGDHVGYAVRACAGKGVRKVIIAGQFAKLLKIACGHEQTHVSSSELDLKMLADWLELKTQNSKLKTAV